MSQSTHSDEDGPSRVRFQPTQVKGGLQVPEQGSLAVRRHSMQADPSVTGEENAAELELKGALKEVYQNIDFYFCIDNYTNTNTTRIYGFFCNRINRFRIVPNLVQSG